MFCLASRPYLLPWLSDPHSLSGHHSGHAYLLIRLRTSQWPFCILTTDWFLLHFLLDNLPPWPYLPLLKPSFLHARRALPTSLTTAPDPLSLPLSLLSLCPTSTSVIPPSSSFSSSLPHLAHQGPHCHPRFQFTLPCRYPLSPPEPHPFLELRPVFPTV